MPKLPKVYHDLPTNPTSPVKQVLDQNIKTRHLSNDFIELGLALCKEERLEANQVRRFWQNVVSIASAIIGDEVLCERCKRIQAKPDTVKIEPTNKLYDDDLMPFGKYKGKPLGKVPEDYLQWLKTTDWITDYPDLLDYLQALDG